MRGEQNDDMNLGIVSMRYAKALLRFAVENKEDEIVYEETAAMARAFRTTHDLQMAMQNPVVSLAQKKRLLAAACATEKLSGTLSKFISLVVDKGRANVMLFISHSYGDLYRSSKHITEASLVVASPIPEDLVDRLRAVVEKRTNNSILFKVSENAALEGGFILEYGTYRLDASVRTQLQRLKRNLMK